MKLIARSLQLDIEFVCLNITLFSKLEFIVKKYLLLIRNFLFGFQTGKSYLSLFGRKYYYDNVYGVAFLQCVYVDNFFLKEHISENSTIIDVGANVGQFYFFCKSLLHAKKVYSFEPIEQSFQLLKLGADESDNVYNFAVTTDSHLQMYIPKTSLMASSIKAENPIYKTVFARGIGIDSIPEIKDEKIIDLFKIDTEGSEFDVIKVSRETLKKSKYILIETSVARVSSGDILNVFDFLKRLTPNIKILWIGRPYVFREGVVDAVDVFFYNDSL